MHTKFNISTQNRDDSGEHALYNRYQSLKALSHYSVSAQHICERMNIFAHMLAYADMR